MHELTEPNFYGVKWPNSVARVGVSHWSASSKLYNSKKIKNKKLYLLKLNICWGKLIKSN